MFGSGAPAATSGQFHFSGVKPKSPVKPSRSRDASLNESVGGEDNEYYQGDEGEHLLFEPVIPLPDKVGQDWFVGSVTAVCWLVGGADVGIYRPGGNPAWLGKWGGDRNKSLSKWKGWGCD